MAKGDLDYVRDYYKVPAKVGGRVRYTWRGDRPGTITGAQGAYLMIRLDGETQSMPFHPTWEIEYVFPSRGCDACGHATGQHQHDGCYGDNGEGCVTCTPGLRAVATEAKPSGGAS